VARAAVALAVITLCLTGCGVVNEAKAAVHDVEGNKATVDAFTSKVQNGESTTFSATYVTTGSAPATVTYAVQPPKELAFTDTPTGSAGPSLDLVVNPSGEFSCTPPSAGSGSPWSCVKLDATTAAGQNQLFDVYTPSHWVSFLKGLALAAGIAGDHVTSSTMTVNGFPLQCVDFVAPGVPGTSTICSTAQGILGYVKVASDATSFAITHYTTSPAASLFQTPPGADISASPSGTT
jgi:hypothetical protein